LTCEGLCDYACDYYHHVKPFPSYLADSDCVWKRANCAGQLLANMLDEKGARDAFGVPEQSHAESWLDFAEGMGASCAFLGIVRSPNGESC